MVIVIMSSRHHVIIVTSDHHDPLPPEDGHVHVDLTCPCLHDIILFLMTVDVLTNGFVET